MLLLYWYSAWSGVIFLWKFDTPISLPPMPNTTYLLISPSDFFAIKRRRYSDRYAFMEAVLRYLEDNDIPHMHCFDSIRVYPIDHFHAQEICDYFRISEMHYFINGKLSKLFDAKKRAQSTYYFDATNRWATFDLIAGKRLLNSVQTSIPAYEPFKGTFIDFKPRLWLFWEIECAVQGSFIK